MPEICEILMIVNLKFPRCNHKRECIFPIAISFQKSSSRNHNLHFNPHQNRNFVAITSPLLFDFSMSICTIIFICSLTPRRKFRVLVKILKPSAEPRLNFEVLRKITSEKNYQFLPTLSTN